MGLFFFEFFNILFKCIILLSTVMSETSQHNSPVFRHVAILAVASLLLSQQMSKL